MSETYLNSSIASVCASQLCLQRNWKVTFLQPISTDLPSTGNLVSPGTGSVYFGVSAKEESAILATHLQWSALAGGKYSWIGKLPEFIQEDSSESGNKGNSSLEHFRACYVLDSSSKVRNWSSLLGESCLRNITLPLHLGGSGFHVGYRSLTLRKLLGKKYTQSAFFFFF